MSVGNLCHQTAWLRQQQGETVELMCTQLCTGARCELIDDGESSSTLMQEHRDPLVAALRYAKSDPTGSVVILVGTHRPPGDDGGLTQQGA